MRPYLFVIIAVVAGVALAGDPYEPTTVEYTPYRGTTPTPSYAPGSDDDKEDSDISNNCPRDLKKKCPRVCHDIYSPVIANCKDGKNWKEEEFPNCCELRREICKGKRCKFLREKEPEPYCTYDLKKNCPDCSDKNCPILCTYIYRPVIAKCKDGYSWKEEEFSNCCELHAAVCRGRDCKFLREKEIQPYCTHDLKKDCPHCTDKHCPIGCTREYRPVIANCKEGYQWKEKEFSNCCLLRTEICKGADCKFLREKESHPVPNQY